MNRKRPKTIIIGASVTLAAILVALLVMQPSLPVIPQVTDASKPMQLAVSHSPAAYVQLYSFGPCDGHLYPNGTGGSEFNPIPVKQGATTIIHMCGTNMDPVAKTYTFEIWGSEMPPNLRLPSNGSVPLPPFFPGQQPRNGIHVNFVKAVTIPAYTEAKGIPGMSNLYSAQDIATFMHTYLRGKKPDLSHFELQVSVDKNATLGTHMFSLVSKYPMKPAGEHVLARAIYVKVVP